MTRPYTEYRDHKFNTTAVDITNQRFGKLIALEPTTLRKRSSIIWKCQCDCGKIVLKASDNLRRGFTKSCGCLVKEKSFRHGHAASNCKRHSRTYESWCRMWQRCNNKNLPAYRYWGGRGIAVCKRWKDFRNFLSDMGERPQGKSIDRINNDGNYEPSN